MLAPLAFRHESFVVLLSITPLLDGVLRLDIIAPFHTSGPPLLQFHLAIEQWGKMIAEYTTVNFPIPFNTVFGIFGERVYAGDNTADISVEKFNATSFTCNMNAYGTWFWSALGF